MQRLLLSLFLAVVAADVRALGPDNLLLITNKNVPESRQLADFYAAQRKVPDGRIVELDLPAVDEISFDLYESRVMPAVRAFLVDNGLAGKVTCAVTFYGVPLKVAARVNTPGDEVELTALRQELNAAVDQAMTPLAALEAIAAECDKTFKPTADKGLAGLVARNAAARGVLGRFGKGINEVPKFEAFMGRIEQAAAPLDGPAQIKQRRLRELAHLGSAITPEQLKEAKGLNQELLIVRAKLEALHARRAEPQGRSELREAVKAQLGLIEYAGTLWQMIDYFKTPDTDASFDSELSLVWWNFYARANRFDNPLHYRRPHRPDLPPTLMTLRLDAPTADLVRNLIAAGIRAEAVGLKGKVVVDAGGNLTIDSKSPAYGAFDRRLHALAEIVRTQTKLTLVFDDKPAVLPAHSVDDVALYTGWYALVNYTPACALNPGSVGYHIASFELTSLRANGRGWCRGLLTDGIAATLGPVNEPFLDAFPPPDEFFPLLLTGKLTLAEVYWKTCPYTSWRIDLIGDPLYTPYRVNPALAAEGLPKALQAALPVAGATTAPR